MGTASFDHLSGIARTHNLSISQGHVAPFRRAEWRGRGARSYAASVIPCDELRRAYAAGQSSKIISERYECSPTTVIKYLRRCGIPVRRPRFQAKRISEALLRWLYIDQGLPIAEIAAFFGVAVSTIGNKRRRFNIPHPPARLAQEMIGHGGSGYG